MLENLNTVDSVIRDKRFPFGHVLLCGCSQTQNDYWYDNYFLTVMCIAGARQIDKFIRDELTVNVGLTHIYKMHNPFQTTL